MARNISLVSLILFSMLLGQFITHTGSPLEPTLANAQTIPPSLGWYQIPNTKIRSVCPDPATYPEIQLLEGCSAVTADWAGGAFDTTRNRLLMRGGGHNGYGGNEIYALNLNSLTIQRLNNPSRNPPTSCSNNGLMPDGTPQAAHTYNHLEYVPGADRMFEFGPSGSVPCGNFWDYTWTFNLSTLTWQNMNPSGTKPSANFGRSIVYDPNTQKVFARDDFHLYSYDYSTNAWTRLTSTGTGQTNGDYKSAFVDPVRRRYIYIIQGQGMWFYDISPGSSYTLQTYTTSGGSAIINAAFPGLAYDPVQDRLIAWAGGDTVYSLNLTTGVWTPITYPGGPGPQLLNGTYGRWRYSPSLNVFVVCNSVDSNCYSLRLTSGSGGGGDTIPPSVPTGLTATAASSNQINLTWNASTDNVGVTGYRVYRNGTQIATVTSTSYSDTGLSASTTYAYTVSAFDAAGNNSAQSASASATTQATSSASADFQARCSGPGVLKCIGFDSAADFTPAVWPNPGLYPAGDNVFRGTFDTTVKASGNGSLKFTIPGGTPANSAGQWRQNFGQSFGQGQSFYVQFRQRFSPEMMSNGSGFGGGGWKQVILHNFQATCANLEITTNNGYYRNFPQMYTDCGQGLIEYTGPDGVILEYSRPYPPGSSGTPGVDYYCQYSLIPSPSNRCAFYAADQWMTFYYEITIGTWGQPNSIIKGWVGYEGQPLKLFINKTNHTLRQDTPGLGFDYLTLLPYDTGKDGRSHPTAYTWYDELIISTQSIPAPGASANPPPAPPTGLRVQ